MEEDRNQLVWFKHGLLRLFVGGLLVRLTVAILLPPGFDEAYYYLYSRNLNWSYFDHPIMVALTTGVGWWLTGLINPFTIRLGALLLYTLSLWLLYRLAVWLFAEPVGELTVTFATLVPLFVIGFGILTSPDNGLMLFWTATLYVAGLEFFPKSITSDLLPTRPLTYQPTWRIALIGGLVGLACLSKYHGFLLGLGLVGFCAVSRPYRRVFWSPWLAVAALAFVITLFPLWYWNFHHDWISFRFQLMMRFDDSESSRFNLLQMIGYGLISIAYLFPLFGFPLWWITGKELVRQGRYYISPNPEPAAALTHYQHGLILWVSLPIMLGFTVLGGKQQIFPAWPAPGFWGLTILLASTAQSWRIKHPRGVRRWLWGSGLGLVALATVAMLHLSFGVLQKPGAYSPLGGLVPVNQDASTELIDIVQLRRQLAASPEAMALLNQVSFVFTNEYYLAGYLDMAIYPLRQLPVTAFSQDPRGLAFWFDQSHWLGQDAAYITLGRFSQTPDPLTTYQANFATLEPVTVVPIERAGVVTETFHLYRAGQFRQAYIYPYGSASHP